MDDQAYIQGSTLQATPAGLLSKRECQALLWTGEGKDTEEIGIIIRCATRTAKSHVHSAMHKLGASNRAHLVAVAYALGLLKPLPNAVARLSARVAQGVAAIVLALGVMSADDSMLRTRTRRVRTTSASTMTRFITPSTAGAA